MYRDREQDTTHVPAPKVSPTSDEYILDLVTRCEERLLKLIEIIGKEDQRETREILKQIQEEEVRLAFSLLLDLGFDISCFL